MRRVHEVYSFHRKLECVSQTEGRAQSRSVATRVHEGLRCRPEHLTLFRRIVNAPTKATVTFARKLDEYEVRPKSASAIIRAMLPRRQRAHEATQRARNFRVHGAE